MFKAHRSSQRRDRRSDAQARHEPFPLGPDVPEIAPEPEPNLQFCHREEPVLDLIAEVSGQNSDVISTAEPAPELEPVCLDTMD